MSTIPDLIAETDSLFSLNDICERCGVHAELIVEMVEYGIVEPLEVTQKRWQFSAAALLRLRRAQRLQRDLDLNLPGLALTLDLLDEIDSLKKEIMGLRHQLEKFRS